MPLRALKKVEGAPQFLHFLGLKELKKEEIERKLRELKHEFPVQILFLRADLGLFEEHIPAIAKALSELEPLAKEIKEKLGVSEALSWEIAREIKLREITNPEEAKKALNDLLEGKTSLAELNSLLFHSSEDLPAELLVHLNPHASLDAIIGKWNEIKGNEHLVKVIKRRVIGSPLKTGKMWDLLAMMCHDGFLSKEEVMKLLEDVHGHAYKFLEEALRKFGLREEVGRAISSLIVREKELNWDYISRIVLQNDLLQFLTEEAKGKILTVRRKPTKEELGVILAFMPVEGRIGLEDLQARIIKEEKPSEGVLRRFVEKNPGLTGVISRLNQELAERIVLSFPISNIDVYLELFRSGQKLRNNEEFKRRLETIKPEEMGEKEVGALIEFAKLGNLDWLLEKSIKEKSVPYFFALSRVSPFLEKKDLRKVLVEFKDWHSLAREKTEEPYFRFVFSFMEKIEGKEDVLFLVNLLRGMYPSQEHAEALVALSALAYKYGGFEDVLKILEDRASELDPVGIARGVTLGLTYKPGPDWGKTLGERLLKRIRANWRALWSLSTFIDLKETRWARDHIINQILSARLSEKEMRSNEEFNILITNVYDALDRREKEGFLESLKRVRNITHSFGFWKIMRKAYDEGLLKLNDLLSFGYGEVKAKTLLHLLEKDWEKFEADERKRIIRVIKENGPPELLEFLVALLRKKGMKGEAGSLETELRYFLESLRRER